LQGLFPLALHTQLVRDDHGQLIQVCTLEGIKFYSIDVNGQLNEEHQPDTRRSAAIEFSSLLTEVIPAIPEVPYISVKATPHIIAQATPPVTVLKAVGLKPARAPPLLFA